MQRRYSDSDFGESVRSSLRRWSSAASDSLFGGLAASLTTSQKRISDRLERGRGGEWGEWSQSGVSGGGVESVWGEWSQCRGEWSRCRGIVESEWGEVESEWGRSGIRVGEKWNQSGGSRVSVWG